MKIPAAKAAVDKEWEKLEKISAWNLTKVKSKTEVIDEARTSGRYSSFCIINGHLSSEKMLNWEAKHQKYKGRVVLRGDVVKDNSGSYAVFTEQGSSASQMTAAKIMDIISKLPSCDGQAADAVSAYTQVKMEDAHKITENSKIGVSRTFGFVYHDTNGQNHGPVWKMWGGVSWSEVATVPKRKSHRGLDLDLSLNSEENIWEVLEGERWHEVEDGDGWRENNHNATHKCTCMDGMTRARRTWATGAMWHDCASMNSAQCAQYRV